LGKIHAEAIHMKRSNDIVSIASWRQQAASRQFGGKVTARSPRTVQFLIGLLLLSLSFVVLGLALAAQRPHPNTGAFDRLPPAERGAWVSRTMQDLEAGCIGQRALPPLLREHCQAQGRFLLLFPECDAACRTAVSRVLRPVP
jgi:hypothetical protein